jgi:hypothetical protein
MCPGPWTIWTDRTVHRVPKRYHGAGLTAGHAGQATLGYRGLVQLAPEFGEFVPESQDLGEQAKQQPVRDRLPACLAHRHALVDRPNRCRAAAVTGQVHACASSQ